ncbi:MAG: hypothetical protein ACJ75J_18125 [Cytophagaceae bacterium]
MSDARFNILLKKLTDYKRKYYFNTLLKGSLLTLTFLSSAYLFFTLLEYYGRFNSYYRITFLSTYVVLFGFTFYQWIITPVLKLTALRRQISDEEASLQIGQFFPQIQDKLLNTIQLRNLNSQQNDLLAASISQKTSELSVFPFVNAIDLKENRKYARFLFWPLLLMGTILLFVPQIFTEGTSRIVNYDKDYPMPAPFTFVLGNERLTAFKNEDYEVKLRMEGSAIPEQVYIVMNGRRAKMKKEAGNLYSFTMNNLQRSESFTFEAAGFNSKDFRLEVLSRPELKSFEAYVAYPKYLGKTNESLKNAGNLSVPEGTVISWNFNTEDAEIMNIRFGNEAKESMVARDGKDFKFTRRFLRSENYEIRLKNKNSDSKEVISYFINVIPDQFPSINAEQFKDTVLFNYISFGGTIGDDHGLSKMKLMYRVKKENEENKDADYQSLPVSIDPRSNNQNFFFNWKLDSVQIKPGEKLEYFFQVWDNDGVNGSKSTKSRSFEFYLPSEQEIKKEIENATVDTENKIEQILKKTLDLNRDLNKIEEKLKNKSEFNWQDKKLLEDVLQKQQEVKKEIEDLNKLNKSLNQKNEKFNQMDPELAKKIEQLQKLMEDLLDDETRKLYEELQKLLEDPKNKKDLQDLVEKLNKKDENLEKEVSRALEMFKQLEFEKKLDNIVNEMKDLAKKQEELSEKTIKKQEDQMKLQEEQKKLNEDFKNLEKEMKDLKDLNESLENKKPMEETGKDQQDIKEDQQKSSDQLGNDQNKKAAESQKNAAQKMNDLAKKMEESKKKTQKADNEENMEDLRAILENLITLSFDQEELMKAFKKVNSSDPQFVSLSQKQLKLKDDSKIIEDSLMALAKRVFQINSFVTREVNSMKNSMDESIEALRDRDPAQVIPLTTGKQQFAMTSINNLALLLNDVLKQMQEQMKNQMKNKGGGQCNNPNGKKPGESQTPGKKPGMGDLGDLQKDLNKKIQALKQSGKTGKELSQELAKLAAQQEMIRNAIKDYQQKNGGAGGSNGNLDKISNQMEKTESDLVNKQITQETLMRQQEILTRLLEAENAVRERDIDNKRESNTGKEINNEVPPAFEKYLKAKEKQIDFLKTVPPSLNPYYKQEVNEYFQKIEK